MCGRDAGDLRAVGRALDSLHDGAQAIKCGLADEVAVSRHASLCGVIRKDARLEERRRCRLGV